MCEFCVLWLSSEYFEIPVDRVADMTMELENPLPIRPSPKLLVRAVDLMLRWHRLLLCIAVLLTAVMWPVSTQLKFDQSIESLYADLDPHLVDFIASRRLFGGDEFVIVAYQDVDLFVPEGNSLTDQSQRRISEFAGKLSNVPGIVSDSTQDLSQALRFPYGRQRVCELATGLLLGNDGQTTAIVLRAMPERESPIPRGETIARIRKLAGEHNPPAVVLGEPVQIHDMFRYVEDDGRKLFVVSIGLLAAVLLILLRKIRWVLLPIAVVLASIVWTEGILVLSRMKLSMVSSMLNSLITIIGVATSLHISLHFREMHRELPVGQALRKSLLELASPVWWAVATTALGFGVLLSSHISPVASFGVMMAIGSLVVLLAVILFVPGFVLLGMMSPEPPPNSADRRVGAVLARITLWVERHPRRVLSVSVASVALAACGFLWLRVETDFSKNFRENSPIVQSLEFFENRLGGAGTWEVNFPAPRELNEEYLSKVRNFAGRLRSEYGVGEFSHDIAADEATSRRVAGRLSKVTSLTDGLDLIPERILFKKLSLESRLGFLSGFQNEFVTSLYNSEAGRMRLVLRAYERQPSETKLKLISDVEQLARETFPSGGVEDSRPVTEGSLANASSTGLFVLLAFLIESLMGDQWTSFILSTVGITAMMWVACRSLPLGLISLVPNLLPNVFVIGLMGWIGLPINIATAMISCVSMGLTVDSSIIYIDGYQRARRNGLRVYPALQETHRHVGRSLVYTNLALMAGFSVLALSHFIPLVYFGLLVSLAMLGGLVGNLVFLPLLIGWWDTRQESRQAAELSS